MVDNIPVFVNHRKEAIHQIRYFSIMWWRMTTDVYGLFPKATAELSDIRDRSRIQRPKCVLIERLNAFLQADFQCS